MLSFFPRRRNLVYLISMVLMGVVNAKSFVVKDIRVEGLQRVAVGTAFNYLTIKPGQVIDPDNASQIISNLYDSHLFSDIKLNQEGNTLVVQVTEFPIIGELNFNGNTSINTSTIKEAFSQSGFTEGQPYNPATLQDMVNQLYQQYQAKNKYQITITPTVKNLPRGRVAVDFEISEGLTGLVSEIEFVGNHVYSNDRLRKLFDTTTGNWASFISKDNQIEAQKLSDDIQRLQNFYFNRGFIDFKIISAQKSLSADKTKVFLQVNVSEGEKYQFTGYDITGNLIVSRNELDDLVSLKSGAAYNRSLADASVNAIKDRLADEGYAQADVTLVPDIDPIAKKIALNFVINPRQKMTVRKIEFIGNSKTYDAVLRREMIQKEMAPYSASDIQRSEQRVGRLPQVANLDKTLKPVPDHPDQIDLVYTVKERATSYIQGGVGYGQESGATISGQYTDDNFFGTGDSFSINLSKSSTYDNYSINFTDPYLTESGVSASYDLFYYKYHYDEDDISDWVSSTVGGSVTFGYPITEYQNIFFGLGYRNVRISLGDDVADEIREYVTENGRKYNEFTLSTAWQKDTTNNAYMPTNGTYNGVSLSATAPGSDVKYYQVVYTNKSYYSGSSPTSPIFDFHTKVSYGAGYGGGKYGNNLPFYKRYYAGGLSTVRGFEYGTIGPKYTNGDSAGGDFSVTGGIELMQPISFSGRVSDFRIGLFVDAGTVTKDFDDFKLSDMRYSAGAFMLWRSPIGPLNISYGIPLNAKDGEGKEAVQFTIGTSF